MNKKIVCICAASLFTWSTLLAHLHLFANTEIILPDTLPDIAGNEKKAQTTGLPIVPLSIGESLPVTHPNFQTGKLIILDFWNVWCTACIKSMPEMEKLQNEFGDKIQVLLVTRDSKEQVTHLIARNQFLQNTHLPIIAGDSLLSPYFAYVTVPTHVWLDSNLKVLQITNGFNTTASAIRKYLIGGNVRLTVKNEPRDFDVYAPLLLEGNGRQRKYFQYSSVITSKIDYEHHTGMSERDSITGRLKWLRAINYTISDLYEMAFKGKLQWEHSDFANRCKIFSRNLDRILAPPVKDEYDNWLQENSWCYEICLPPEKSADIFDYMLQDIDRYFNLKTSIIKKRVDCLVLTKNRAHPGKIAAPSIQEQESKEKGVIIIDKRPVSQSLLLTLKYILKNNIVLDETNYTGNISMQVHYLVKDVNALRRELLTYGFTLKKKSRLVNFIVIKDR